eukprot:4596641-Prorocentrum_lima.AAC.1
MWGNAQVVDTTSIWLSCGSDKSRTQEGSGQERSDGKTSLLPIMVESSGLHPDHGHQGKTT